MKTKNKRLQDCPRHILRLYRAVANYAKVEGGSVLVAGGVQIQQWPNEPKFNYSVAVKCTGRLPELAREKCQKVPEIERRATREK
jgi:hypothetical protein